MIGAPGSGKSTFSKAYAKDYARTGLDEVESNPKKFKEQVPFELTLGKSVIIDNCNHHKE